MAAVRKHATDKTSLGAPSALGYTAHALHRWMTRAPRVIRSKQSFFAALASATRVETLSEVTDEQVFIALGMRLLVRGGVVITCMPTSWRWNPRPSSDAQESNGAEL